MKRGKYKTVYSITTEDLQNVAVNEINRSLSNDEIKRIADKLGDRINWYDIILDLINEKIED